MSINIKLSQIGTGKWGKRLLFKFDGLSEIYQIYGKQNRKEIEQELGLVEQKSPEFEGRRRGITFAKTLEELIGSGEVIIIATPPETHFELGIKALEAGKDIFVEKPLALSSGQAEEMARLADEKNLILMVNHTLCYSKAYQRLKTLPGTPQKAEAYFLKTSSKERKINAYWNLGIHMVGLAVALGVDDILQLEALDKAPKNKRTFQLITNRQSLTWDFLAPENQEDALMTACQHFLDCIKNHQTPLTNGWHAVKTIKTLERMSPEIFKY